MIDAKSLDRLKKLLQLANHNPSEHESNAAARQVCKRLEQFKVLDTAAIESRPPHQQPQSPPRPQPQREPTTSRAKQDFYEEMLRNAREEMFRKKKERHETQQSDVFTRRPGESPADYQERLYRHYMEMIDRAETQEPPTSSKAYRQWATWGKDEL